VLDLLQQEGIQVPANTPDAYAVVPDAASVPAVAAAVEALRAAGVAVVMHAAGKDGQGSFKSQFKKADGSGARFALVFGADELAQGMVAVKPLRDASAQQVLRPLADVASWAANLAANPRNA
jgi:histidyl-tRNA synthetase